MNLKYSGLLFVLIVIFEAISAGPANVTSKEEPKTAPGLLVVSPITEVPVIPEAGEVVGEADKANTTTTTTTTTTSSTTTTTTSTTTTTTSTTLRPTVPPSPPSPAPASLPEKGNWTVYNATTKTTCIIADMAMQLNITYPGKMKDVNTALVNVPKNATAMGSCDSANQTVQISWGPGYSLVINFKANQTVKNFFVSGFSLTVNATILKDAKVVGNNTMWSFTNKTSEFRTPLDMSYKCNKVQDLNLESEDPKRKAVLSLRETQLEAFMNKTKAQFGAAQDCETMDTPDIVPLAVGCALAILVLVVLVAYLIGRKRSQNRGYLSMFHDSPVGKIRREREL